MHVQGSFEDCLPAREVRHKCLEGLFFTAAFDARSAGKLWLVVVEINSAPLPLDTKLLASSAVAMGGEYVGCFKSSG